MESKPDLRKTLIFNVLDFLSNEQKAEDLSPLEKEWLGVVSQSLETVYKITKEDEEKLEKHDLIKFVCGDYRDDSSVKRRKRLAEYYRVLGNKCMHHLKYKEALNEYTRSLHVVPDDALVFFSRANAYMHLQQYEKAIADCETALVLKPDYAMAHGRMGVALLKLEQWNKAISEFQKVTEIDPNNHYFDICLEFALDHVFEGVESAIPDKYQPKTFKSFINHKPYMPKARDMKLFPDELKLIWMSCF